jgi:uncharacterized protein with GYD domain
VATFISIIRFTEQGLSKINKTTRRASAFKSAAKKMGIKVKDIYWTLGAFDGAIVFDAPDDETASAAYCNSPHRATCRRRQLGLSTPETWRRFWRNCRSECARSKIRGTPDERRGIN